MACKYEIVLTEARALPSASDGGACLELCGGDDVVLCLLDLLFLAELGGEGNSLSSC